VTLRDNILHLLKLIPGGCAQSIATDLYLCGCSAATLSDVQAALHALEDAGCVYGGERGWYALTERQKCRN